MLKGIGEEPLEEEHLALKCKARNKSKHKIAVPNFYKDRVVTYRIESDIVNITGDSSITIGPSETKSYVFYITPTQGGTYTGSITFHDDTYQRFVWYTIEV